MGKSKSRKMLLFPQEKSKSKLEDNLTSSCQWMVVGRGGGVGGHGWCGRQWWQPVLRERRERSGGGSIWERGEMKPKN